MKNFPTIHNYSPAIQTTSSLSANGAASATFASADMAFFYPVKVYDPFTATRLFVLNGSAVSGNIDVGIYSSQGNRIVSSGSTAQSGTTAIQEFDVTDTIIYPGVYYLAVAMDNTTGSLFANGIGAARIRAAHAFQQSTAFPLPATATFAAYTTTNNAYWIGMTNRSFV